MYSSLLCDPHLNRIHNIQLLQTGESLTKPNLTHFSPIRVLPGYNEYNPNDDDSHQGHG